MSPAKQAWDRADHSCGTCGHKFTATTEADYLTAWQTHAAAHDIAAALITVPRLRDQVDQLLLPTGPPAHHECHDCPKYGGIGFDCHHLVRGRRLADTCDWCREQGLTPGQEIPRRT